MWDTKGTSKSELHYTSKNIETYLKNAYSIISQDYYHAPTMIQILCLILEIYFNDTTSLPSMWLMLQSEDKSGNKITDIIFVKS